MTVGSVNYQTGVVAAAVLLFFGVAVTDSVLAISARNRAARSE